MSRPLFSVVIPTYNRSDKVLRALQSLNQQQFKNFEVIVSDDGSDDDTREVVEAFRSHIQFEALHYLYDDNWGGPARPRNIGTAAASAEWICFLDSDDSWHPEKLKTLLPFLDQFDFIYHDFDLVDDTGKLKLLHSRQLQYPVFQDLMLKGHNGCIINSGVCVRKKLVEKAEGFSEDRHLIGVEDADLWLKISRLTDRFKYIRKSLGTYFLDGGNLTHYNQRMIDKLELLFSLHSPYLLDQGMIKLARKTNNYHLGRIRRIMGDTKEALELFKSALGSPNSSINLRSIYWIVFLHSRLPASMSNIE